MRRRYDTLNEKWTDPKSAVAKGPIPEKLKDACLKDPNCDLRSVATFESF